MQITPEFKKSAILAAQLAGYFRAKSEEKRVAIFGDLCELEDYQGDNGEALKHVLQAETKRRSDAYHARQSQTIARQIERENLPLTGGVDSADAHVKTLPDGVYILTVAQNNTEVDTIALQCLENMAEHYGAKILCARMTYNKNGFQQGQDAPLFYAPELDKYMVDGHYRIGGAIDFVANANVIPTARNPLSGFESVSPPDVSAIIPASKIALSVLPSVKGRQGKILYATGTITKRNYMQRKAGSVAATEHNIGALLCYVADGRVTCRQLELMPGCDYVCDDGLRFYANGTSEYESPECLQFGDVHAEKLTNESLTDLIDLLYKYRPRHVMLHDVCDFSTRNHHNIKDPHFLFQQLQEGNTVRGDIQKIGAVINELASVAECTIHVIESNHDCAINTWLKNQEPVKNDPENAVLWLECTLALYKSIQNEGRGLNMLKYCLQNFGALKATNVLFHEIDDSVIFAGIEHGLHGHLGANGSKGSPNQFRKLGIPMNTGHTHSPSIIGRVYTSGCCELDMGYNKGPSSWRVAHIATYANGQRQLLTA